MSRPGVTYQEIANTAVELQGKDENPTVDRIREHLGTGSKSTIARYLKEWRSKTGHFPGSDGIPDELLSIVKGLWERLKEDADSKITKHQKETDLSIGEIKQMLAQEQRQNVDLQVQIRQFEEQLHHEKHLATTLRLSLEEEKRTNTKFIERNDRLSQQLSDQKSEVERLHQLLAHVQANLEHYQTSIQKLREEQMLAAEKQKAIYEQEIRIYKKEISQLNIINNQLKNDCSHFSLELDMIKNQLNSAQAERTLHYQQLQEKIIVEVGLKNHCAQLQQSYDDYQNKLEQKSKIITDLEKKQAILTNQLENLQKSLYDAQDTIRILRDEKLYLAQEKAYLEGQLEQLQTSL